MNFMHGHYETACGYRAVVVQLRQQGVTDWIARGYIEDPHTNARCIHVWSLSGISLGGDPRCNLVKNNES